MANESCTTLAKGDTVEYNFNVGEKKRRLVFAIPPGSVSETHQRDANGNLVRTFYYKDGAEFFIACRDGDNQPNIMLARQSEDLESLQQKTGRIGSGTYQDGTHWSRQNRDGFIVGYDFVNSSKTELFDQAMHSVLVKK